MLWAYSKPPIIFLQRRKWSVIPIPPFKNKLLFSLLHQVRGNTLVPGRKRIIVPHCNYAEVDHTVPSVSFHPASVLRSRFQWNSTLIWPFHLSTCSLHHPNLWFWRVLWGGINITVSHQQHPLSARNDPKSIFKQYIGYFLLG